MPAESEEKVYITCQWCRKEWTIKRSVLDNANLPHILHRFDADFEQTVSLRLKILTFKGRVAAEFVSETDLCASCSLLIIKSCIQDMIDHGIEPQ